MVRTEDFISTTHDTRGTEDTVGLTRAVGAAVLINSTGGEGRSGRTLSKGLGTLVVLAEH